MRRTSAAKTCGTPRPDLALQPYSRRFGLPTGGFTPTPEVHQACSMDQHTDVKAAAPTPSSAAKCSGPGPSSDGAELRKQLFAPSDPVSEHSETASDRPIIAPQPGHEETPGLLAEATESQPTPVAIQHEPKEEPPAQEEHVKPEAAGAEELTQGSRLSLSAWLCGGAQPAATGKEDQPEVLGPHTEDEAAGQHAQPQVSASVLAKQGSAAHAARLEAVAQSWFPQPSLLMPFAGPETADGAHGQQGMDIGFPSAESGPFSKPLQSSKTQPPLQQPLQQPEDEEQSSNHAQTSVGQGAAAMQPATSALRRLAAVDRRVKLTKLAEQRICQSANIKKDRAAAAKSEAFNNLGAPSKRTIRQRANIKKGGAATSEAVNNLDAAPEQGCPPTVGLFGMPPICPTFFFGAQNPTTQRNADQGKLQPSVPQEPVSRRPVIPESSRPPKAAGKTSTQALLSYSCTPRTS